MKPYLIVSLFFLLGCQSAQIPEGERAPAQDQTFAREQEVILDHKYFKVSYNKEHRLPKWVEYTLSKADLLKQPGKRSNKFRPDPLLKKMGIEGMGKDDIPGDKFDRGHMAPADDFKRNQEALDETFVTSNIAPQKSTLNQSPWLRLESTAQKWACGENEVVIITGPILRDDLPKLAKGISVPDQFFKAVYTRNPSKKYPKGKSVCFIYHQNDDKKILPKDRAMTVSECEKTIGFDIGPKDLQFTENEFNLKDWRSVACAAKN